jgi:hypothetical protein
MVVDFVEGPLQALARLAVYAPDRVLQRGDGLREVGELCVGLRLALGLLFELVDRRQLIAPRR